MSTEPFLERALLGVAHALYMNRLHVLRLTEVVRLRIEPDAEGMMELPQKLDEEMKQQAFDYVSTCMPREMGAMLHQAKADWIRLA